MSDNNYPLTLADVLYRELYDDPTSQRVDSLGDKLNQEIRRAREEKNKDIKLPKNSWFDASEEQDWEKRKKASEEIVETIYRAIHFPLPKPNETPDPTKPPKPNPPRAALCLSGGGVRSATFNLGVLQGLARCGLLEKFDYLSTVSGGGFIGSWLTAWIHRAEEARPGHGLEDVIDQLARPPKSPLDPEPKPLSNLRVYANYLTPRKGLLSPDTFTLIAVYLRNLILNWLVFLPAIMAFLMLPRIWLALVRLAYNAPAAGRVAFGVLGVIFGVISLKNLIANLPSGGNENWENKKVIRRCIFPLVLTAMLLSLYWIGVGRQSPPLLVPSEWWHFWEPFYRDFKSALFGNRPGWPTFLLVGALIPAAPQLVVVFNRIREPNPTRKQEPAKWLVTVILVLIGGAVTGVLTYALAGSGLLARFAKYAGVEYGQLYACVAVSYVISLLTVGGTLVAGLSSRFSGSDDQEWWARCGAYMLLAEFVWCVLSLIVTFGPFFLVNIPDLFRGGNWGTTKGVVTTITGIISGALTLFGGFSSKTPASTGKDESVDWKAKLVSVAISVAAALFLVFLLIVLVWLTDWALFGLAKTINTLGYSRLVAAAPALGGLPNQPLVHKDFLDQSHLLLQLIGAVVFFASAGIIGYFINTNRFSLHYYWRNRMMRTYLGASHENTNTRNHFTGFDMEDNIPMCELNKKPLHVVDVTLNLVGGEKLAWQDRKAESFTMSPLHCGSYWLGYRDSRNYGGERGMSLATAVAISGAAASPNMGYMMTSPIVRFIMTLFNIRLGFWLGNPGPNCGDTYKLDSPKESVWPIIEEALGQTDDKSSYVYLSDGGHFENLGLYEMILRRCRFIVVSDASTDTEYAYESLAIAIRQIRVDFGVPIDMGEMKFDKKPDPKNNYCALGLIKYSCVDRPGGSGDADEDAKYDGVLIYLKPSLIGDEPRDVLNYHAASPTFPEETITDQWFSEPQFESYRALGSHMIEKICLKPDSSRTDETKKIEIGAKVSAAVASAKQEFSIEGWIDKLRQTGDDKVETSALDKRIEAVIKKLIPNGKTLENLGCGDFAKFASEAQKHVSRQRESPAKNVK